MLLSSFHISRAIDCCNSMIYSTLHDLLGGGKVQITIYNGANRAYKVH